MGFLDKYPYTNWHNVNLDWVLERVKEWGEMVEANDQAFKDLEEANASFKDYVTNYLQDLDVQAQIDDKLDRMFESGELTDYLQPYVSDSVTNWLEEHITEPVGVVIDSSLTVAGAAADAKATGTAIQNVALSDIARNALLECFQQLAWIIENGYYYYNNLQRALYNWGSDLIYKLMNTPVNFTGAEYINTSTVLWDSDYSFTIFCEYIDGTNHFRDTENKMLFREARTGTPPWANIYIQSWNGGSIDSNTYNVRNGFRFSNGTEILAKNWIYSENKNTISNIVNRFVVSYDKDTKSVICGFSHNNTILQPVSEEGNFENFNFVEFNSVLTIGGILNESTRRFKGVINDFAIYKESINTETMNNYLMGVSE